MFLAAPRVFFVLLFFYQSLLPQLLYGTLRTRSRFAAPTASVETVCPTYRLIVYSGKLAGTSHSAAPRLSVSSAAELEFRLSMRCLSAPLLFRLSAFGNLGARGPRRVMSFTWSDFQAAFYRSDCGRWG